MPDVALQVRTHSTCGLFPVLFQLSFHRMLEPTTVYAPLPHFYWKLYPGSPWKFSRGLPEKIVTLSVIHGGKVRIVYFRH